MYKDNYFLNLCTWNADMVMLKIALNKPENTAER